MTRKYLRRIFKKITIPESFIKMRQMAYQNMGYHTILVYTMGKVGSTSLYSALKERRLNIPLVYHVHLLTKPNIKASKLRYKNAGIVKSKNISLLKLIRGNFDHLDGSNALYNIKPNKKWILISIVRDPIDIFFSSTFQNPHIHRPQILDLNGKIDPIRVKTYINDYVKNFNPKKDHFLSWFDEEFNKYTGLDVYKYDFNHRNGYMTLKTDKFNIIIISLKRMEEQICKAMEEVLGRTIKLDFQRKNKRSSTKDGELYYKIKSQTTFDRSFLNMMYSTKYATHFFDKRTRQEKIDYWSRTRFQSQYK